MSKQVYFEENNLGKYINPERIEKAPEGFTSRTMTRIQIETGTSKAHRRIFLSSPVPLVSILITTCLVAAVIFLPSGSAYSPDPSFLKYLSNLGFLLQKINFPHLPVLNLPEWISYGFIVILLLALIDSILSGILKKQRK